MDDAAPRQKTTDRDDFYERDGYGWALREAALLRSGRLGEADIENIAEEIESMGKSQKQELASRLAILLLHLVKWQYQPARRGPSWEATIRVQRIAITDHLGENPSLRPLLPTVVGTTYRRARVEAFGETGLPIKTFPEVCPWPFEKIMDEAFWPA